MKVIKRTITGKYTKKLRKSGLIPAVIYDKDTNISVQIPVAEFIKVYEEKGHTGIVNVEVDSAKYNILIDHVQIDPVKRIPLHATLREVNLKEEINAEVPIKYINAETSVGVKTDGGIVIENIQEVEIIALPTKIPHEIEVDIQHLALGDVIKLEDIRLPDGVKFASKDEDLLSQVAVTITHKAAEEEVVAAPTEVVVAESTKEKKKEEAPAAAPAKK